MAPFLLVAQVKRECRARAPTQSGVEPSLALFVSPAPAPTLSWRLRLAGLVPLVHLYARKPQGAS